MSADKKLTAMAKTFAQRRAVYGDNYMRVGPALHAMLGDVRLRTPEDHTRYYMLAHIVTKLSRYCNNFSKGGHQDSIHDAAVYCAMLESIDE